MKNRTRADWTTGFVNKRTRRSQVVSVICEKTEQKAKQVNHLCNTQRDNTRRENTRARRPDNWTTCCCWTCAPWCAREREREIRCSFTHISLSLSHFLGAPWCAPWRAMVNINFFSFFFFFFFSFSFLFSFSSSLSQQKTKNTPGWSPRRRKRG